MQNQKRRSCGFCNEAFTISLPKELIEILQRCEANSPSNQWVNHMIWLCPACMAMKDRCLSFSSFAEGQAQMQKKLDLLTQSVETIKACVSYAASPGNRIVGGDEFDPGYGSISSGSFADNGDSSCCMSSGSSSIGFRSPSAISVSTHPSSLKSTPGSNVTPVNSRRNSSSSSTSGSISKTVSFQSNSSSKRDSSVLKDLLAAQIKVNREEEKTNKEISLNFLNALVAKLKDTDDVFKCLYHKMYHTGSSFEGLRIADANEFDVNCVLKFPFKQNTLIVKGADGQAMWATYKVIDRIMDPYIAKEADDKTIDVYRTLGKKGIIDENGYIMPSKIREWLQSVISIAGLSSFDNGKDIKKVTESNHGPAKTLTIHTHKGCVIDIDFVPVFEFVHPDWPQAANRDLFEKFYIPEANRFWFLVPKEYKNPWDDSVGLASARRMWRIHFPEIEKQILHDRGCAKSLVKLLKLLRDKLDWKFLASYFIKTTVMWAIIENPDLAEWKEVNLADRFVAVMEKLFNCLNGGCIRHILFQDANLLENQSKIHMKNVANRMKGIMKRIDKDFTNEVKKVYGFSVNLKSPM